MSIEINQEKLIVPGIEGSTPIEVSPEVTNPNVKSVQTAPLESVSQPQVPVNEGVKKESLPSEKVPAVVLQTSAGDGSGWVVLLESKEEGGEIEVL